MKNLRDEFPALQQKVHGKPLVYLDNAATTLKPRSVIDAMERYYCTDTANVHRGVYLLSERATEAYEGARTKVQRFLNASESQEIVFVRGTTEAINLVAASYGRSTLRKDDEIVLSTIEHHSNIVPWQILCGETGAKLRIVPVNDRGELLMKEYERTLNDRTRIVSIAHVSNAIGTIHPIKTMIEMAHSYDAVVLIDGAQAAAHIPVDVQDLNCDFYAFSGHKLYGPTGIGVLYGKSKWLEQMPPYQGGGEMINSVTFEKTTYNRLPHKFEAGTPSIAEAIGLGAASDFVNRIGFDAISSHENELLSRVTKEIQDISGIRIIGTARQKGAILSFVLEGVHPHDVGTILDREGIAIRAGHHCAMPTMQRFEVPATVRASFACYNTKDEVDYLVSSLHKVREIFH